MSRNKGGERQFDIKIAGTVYFDDYDIYAESGGNTATSKTVQLNVTTGQINVALKPSIGEPKVSAIEIVSLF